MQPIGRSDDFGGGGRCQRLCWRRRSSDLLGHPGLTPTAPLTISCVSPRPQSAGEATRRAPPAPASAGTPGARANRRGTFSPARRSSSWVCRTATFVRSWLKPEDTLIVDCGADFRLTDADDWTYFRLRPTPATGPYGLPNCWRPRRGSRPTRHRRCPVAIRPRRCWPAPCGGRRPDRARVTVVAVGRAPRAPCGEGDLSSRGHRIGTGVQHRRAHRHTPEIARPALGLDRASGPFVHPGADPDPAASWPPAPPAPKHRCPRSAPPTKRPTTQSRSSICCPRRSTARTDR